MKQTLSIFFIFAFFTFNYPAFAVSKYNHFKRLSCSQVLSDCTSIQGLEEEEYLPPDEDDDLEAYIEEILDTYTSEELQDICKSCVVTKSRNSKCINRGIKKCKKELGPKQSGSNDLLFN